VDGKKSNQEVLNMAGLVVNCWKHSVNGNWNSLDI